MRFARSLALGLLCASLLATSSATAAEPAVGPPTATSSWVAHIVIDSDAYATPDEGGRSVGRVHARTPWSQSPTELMVNDVAVLPSGEQWIEVLLARKPNGSYGWIKADNTKLSRTVWRVAVDLSSRRLTVLRAGKRVRSTRVVVGARRTPTPTGQFAVREVVKQPDAAGFSGPWIFHLNANSERLRTFDGSDAVIGIHGRGRASLGDPLGSARSHGCVRIPNSVIRYMAKHVAAGSPVSIVN